MRNINHLIRTQFPKFMREGDHEKFIVFMQAYYDWLNKEENPDGIFGNYNDLNDIDKTLDPFLKKFIASFAFGLPSRFFETKRDAIKHLKEIHSIKGTPESYKKLFRLLFDEVIDFYFPEEDILRSSGAKWIRKSMVAFTSASFPNIVDKIVRSANCSFYVLDVILADSDRNIYFAEFDPETFEGFFDEAEDIMFWSVQAPEFNGFPATAITGVNILTEGSGYEPNYRFIVNDDINEAVVNIDRVGRDHYGLFLTNIQGDPIFVDDFITQDPTSFTQGLTTTGQVTRIAGNIYYVAGGEFQAGGVTVVGNQVLTLDTIAGGTIVVGDTIVKGTALGTVVGIVGNKYYTTGLNFTPGEITVEGKATTATITTISSKESTATVTAITGEIKDIRILTQSYRGTANTTSNIPAPPNGGDAALIEILTGTFFIQNIIPTVPYNQPSGRSKIQDGVFYSPYTYVIKSGQSINIWKDMLMRMIHPAGIGIFSQVLILSVFKAGVAGEGGVTGQSQNTLSIYNWELVDGLLQFFRGLDLYFNTYLCLKNNSYVSEYLYSVYKQDIGYFDRLKFLVPPYGEGVAHSAQAHRFHSSMPTEYYSITENQSFTLGGYEPPITYDHPDPATTEGGNTVTDAYHIPGSWDHKNFIIANIENMTIDMFEDPKTFPKYKINFQPGSFIRFHDVV